MMTIRTWRWKCRPALCVLVLCLLCLAPTLAEADEFSILKESSVIGRSDGYPSGTPSQGQTAVGTLDLVTEMAVFLKNNELLGLEEIEGQTFIGFLLPLRLRYRAHERLSLEAGAVLGQDFGDESALNTADPLLRVAYQPTAGLFIIAGTIVPTHWIHDAMQDDAQNLRDTSEQGFQLRASLDWLLQDIWINWRVRETALDAEEFEIGNASRLRFWHERLWVDGQLMWVHAGGQITASNRLEQNLSYLVGASIGLRHPFGWEWVEEMRAGGHYLSARDDTRNKAQTQGRGREFFARLDITPRERLLWRLFGSYYWGDGLIARRGDPLYSLNRYSQAGTSAVFQLVADLQIELGMVYQRTEATNNYSYTVNFTWGHAFRTPVR